MKITDNTNWNHIQATKKEMEKSINEVGSGKKEVMDEASLQMLIDTLGSEISTTTQEITNSNNSIAMLQIASSSLDSLSKMGDELNQLSVQYNSAALNSDQKSMIASQSEALKRSMNDVIDSTIFNGKNLFSSDAFESMGVDLSGINVSDIEITNQDSIKDFTTTLNSAFSSVSSATNREISNINNLSEKLVNQNRARSINADTDIAENINNITNQNIKLNASLIAQAHQQSLLASSMATLLN
jgi:flagellin